MIATARPIPTRYEDMKPADLDALYIRIAQAVKRFEARQAEPLTITSAPLVPPGNRRGPYRRRTRPVGVTDASRA